jgi:hypothetical protein
VLSFKEFAVINVDGQLQEATVVNTRHGHEFSQDFIEVLRITHSRPDTEQAKGL